MIVKRNILAMAALAACLLTPSLRANPSIVIDVGTAGTGYGIWQTGSGGEFTFTVVSGSGIDLAGYVSGESSIPSGISGLGTFETFCVEDNVYIYPSTQITGVLSSQNSEGQVLTEGTAWLYSQFAHGTLAGYDYNNDSGHNTSAGNLQNAIWYFMHQDEDINLSSIDSNPYVELAKTEFSNPFDAAGGNNFDVGVLQLSNSSGGGVQNQLALESVPDGGATFGLLALSITGMGLAARCLRS